MNYYKHSTAEVSPKAKVGKETKIWHFTRIREKAEIGSNCILGSYVYIDIAVKIGSKVKIENKACLFQGTTIEDKVFIGPHVCFANDKNPRSTNSQDNLKSSADWKIGKILVKKGASIGANTTILPSVIIGQYAMIGAGSVVTKNIPSYALAYGNPAKIHGKVDKQGNSE